MILDFDDFDIKERFCLIEEKMTQLNMLLETLPPEKQHQINEFCIQAYIFHDSALEGVFVSLEEIDLVFNYDLTPHHVKSRPLQEIRNQKRKLEEIFDEAKKYREVNKIYRSSKIDLQDLYSCHEILYFGIPRKSAPKIRTSPPTHSSYFHEVAPVKNLKEELHDLCQKTCDADFRTQHPINQAAVFHYYLMQLYPFAEGSGKIARLFMNSFLLQGGYELAIIHASNRQKYYESLKDDIQSLRLLILESLESTIESKLSIIQDQRISNLQKTFKKKSLNFATNSMQI